MRLLPKLLLLVVLAVPCLGKGFYIHVHGVVTDHHTGTPLKGAEVVLVKDGIERETVSTNWNGRYELYLERGYDYLLRYQRPGCVTKSVMVDAREVPLFPDVPFFEMDIQMTMFEHIDDFDLSAFDLPVGKAEYKHSVRNLNWNVEYTQARRNELMRVMIRYDREVEARRRALRTERIKADRKKRRTVHF